MKHISKIIVCCCLLVALCACTETDSVQIGPSLDNEAENPLYLNDIELANTYAWIELKEEDNVFFTNKNIFENWQPKYSKGYAIAKKPHECIISAALPYSDAAIEEVATCLTKMFIHTLMNPQIPTNASFLITAYTDIETVVYTYDTLPDLYKENIQNTGTSGHEEWYVIPSLRYKYIGVIDGVESNGEEWFEHFFDENYCLRLWLYVDNDESDQKDFESRYILKSTYPEV